MQNLARHEVKKIVDGALKKVTKPNAISFKTGHPQWTERMAGGLERGSSLLAREPTANPYPVKRLHASVRSSRGNV